MSVATYVSLVPRSLRGKLREALTAEAAGAISWRERKGMFVSEFYFSGPPELTRKTHAFVTRWLSRHG